MSEIYKALRRVQTKREEGASSENGPHPQRLLEEMLPQTESILRVSEDIERRMSEAGVDGIDGILSLSDRLREAMKRVEIAEIDASTRDIDRLIETMQRARDELQHVKALKLSLEGTR